MLLSPATLAILEATSWQFFAANQWEKEDCSRQTDSSTKPVQYCIVLRFSAEREREREKEREREREREGERERGGGGSFHPAWSLNEAQDVDIGIVFANYCLGKPLSKNSPGSTGLADSQHY